MKLLTLIQAAALVVLAVAGAYAASDTQQTCSAPHTGATCDL
ncbi:MAG: hypothetical protein QNJ09_15595 [Paracoccaceae bacterium]|nr:hypothetical protein [Paracoccaceae bacterium]